MPAAAIPELRPWLAYMESLMICKHPLWYAKVEDDSYNSVWRARFLHRPDTARIAEAMRYEAEVERKAAAALTATPDAPGSQTGGGPSNNELAVGLSEYAAKLEATADKVQVGIIVATITFCDSKVFD